MGNTIIIFGIIFVIVGILMNIISKIGFPLLPGDILIKRENFTLYAPIVSSTIVSLLLTILVRLVKK